MERRDFIRLSTLSVGAGLVAPVISVAETEKHLKGAADIY